MQLPYPSGLVTLLTDFGTRDPYVGLMKGMVTRAHGRAQIVDLCHEVPPQDVALGALFLRSAVGRFPDGTVHVAVVDPGVGGQRRFVAVCAHRCYWLAPDNGVLTPVLPAPEGPGEVRVVDVEKLELRPVSATFHGRDVFAPLAGLLASGRYGFHAVGPLVRDPVRLEGWLAGDPCVVHVDRFGNLITNIDGATVREQRIVAFEVAGRRASLRQTYSEAEVGDLLAVINSYDLLEIAVRDGNAEELLGVGLGTPVAAVKEEAGG